jgi:predicted dehydrogenase
MSKTYRAGIIGRTGKGDYGHKLDTAFIGLPNVEIASVADWDEAGLKAAHQRTGATRAYRDYRDMLAREQLDLVVVAPRWVDCHHDMVVACAEAGVRGIFCEKSFSATLAEADAMMVTCQQRGVRVVVAHRRASAYEQLAKKQIDEGLIGQVQVMRAQGKGDHRSGGQDLMILGTHLLESMRHIAGSEVAWAMGHVSQDGRDVTAADAREGGEGLGLVAGNELSGYYVFQNGIRAHFESRPVLPRGQHTSSRWFGFEVYGTEGILSVRNSPAGELYVYPHGMWLPDDAEIKWERMWIDRWERCPDPMHASNQMIVNELIAAIESDRDVVTAASGEDARAALEMAVAIPESHRLGGRVAFPLANRENPYTRWRAEKF